MLVSISGSAKRQQARVPSALDNAQIRISRGLSRFRHRDQDATGGNAAGLKQKNRDGTIAVAGGDEWS